MTTTTTTTTPNVFIQDYDLLTLRSDGIVQTRSPPSRLDPNSIEYCLQIDTHKQTVHIYSIHTRRFVMEVKVLSEGVLDLSLLSPAAYRAYTVMNQPVPNVYTACPSVCPTNTEDYTACKELWRMDYSTDWRSLFEAYRFYRVHAIRFIGSQIMIHVTNPSAHTHRLLVCNNTPWVFSRMLDLNAADVFTRDLGGLQFPTLFDLYTTLAEEFKNADAATYSDPHHHRYNDAVVLARRMDCVAKVIQDGEKGFLHIFNEDKTLKSFVTKDIAKTARDVAENHSFWFLDNHGRPTSHVQKVTSLYIPEVNTYIAVLSKFIQCRCKRPASEISPDGA
jgi:hypothetical protein